MLLIALVFQALAIYHTSGFTTKTTPFKVLPEHVADPPRHHRQRAYPDLDVAAWADKVRDLITTARIRRNKAPVVRQQLHQNLPFMAWFIGVIVIVLVGHGCYRMWSHGYYANNECMPASRPNVLESQSSTNSPSPLLKFIQTAVVVILWMILSAALVIYNKWLFVAGGFPHPLTLTTMHMCSCFVVFGILSWLPLKFRVIIMPDVDKEIKWTVYLKGLFPAAVLMALSFGFGNLGFLYATVAFIHMVKPINIVLTSIASFIWGLEIVTSTHCFIVILVCIGVVIAAAGETAFSSIGLICTLVGAASESVKIVILQSVMQTNFKLDPMTTIYRLSLIAALGIGILAVIIEQPVKWDELKYPWTLAVNCFAAVILNVLILSVIKKTSAVVFVFSGIFKDIITIAASTALFQAKLTPLEYVGYAVSICGICFYKLYKDNLELFKKESFLHGSSHALRTAFAHCIPSMRSPNMNLK